MLRTHVLDLEPFGRGCSRHLFRSIRVSRFLQLSRDLYYYSARNETLNSVSPHKLGSSCTSTDLITIHRGLVSGIETPRTRALFPHLPAQAVTKQSIPSLLLQPPLLLHRFLCRQSLAINKHGHSHSKPFRYFSSGYARVSGIVPHLTQGLICVLAYPRYSIPRRCL